ncbi:MAG: hypothetical protein JOZ59_06520 [Candidatus Eremiobacteraeota bacterium]|nr:hypothetical protein [Candidatus Eremiobacteraeota bacterium]
MRQGGTAIVSLGGHDHALSLAERFGMAGPLLFIVLVLGFVLLMEYQRSAKEGPQFWGHRVKWLFASIFIVAVAMSVFIMFRGT